MKAALVVIFGFAFGVAGCERDYLRESAQMKRREVAAVRQGQGMPELFGGCLSDCIPEQAAYLWALEHAETDSDCEAFPAPDQARACLKGFRAGTIVGRRWAGARRASDRPTG